MYASKCKLHGKSRTSPEAWIKRWAEALGKSSRPWWVANAPPNCALRNCVASERRRIKTCCRPCHQHVGLALAAVKTLKKYCAVGPSADFREIWNTAAQNAAAHKGCPLVYSKAFLSASAFRYQMLAPLWPQSVAYARLGEATSGMDRNISNAWRPSPFLMERARACRSESCTIA